MTSNSDSIAINVRGCRLASPRRGRQRENARKTAPFSRRSRGFVVLRLTRSRRRRRITGAGAYASGCGLNKELPAIAPFAGRTLFQVLAYTDLEVEIASVQNAKLLDDKYDVVLLSAILEHLYNPVEILLKVRGALLRGGLVFIDVPNESSLSMHVGNAYMKLRRRPW